jgi:hypothetical protein
VDDASGVISVIYGGPMTKIREGDDVHVKGRYANRDDTIIAHEVTQSGVFALDSPFLWLVIVILVGSAYIIYKKGRLQRPAKPAAKQV